MGKELLKKGVNSKVVMLESSGCGSRWDLLSKVGTAEDIEN